MRGPPPRERRDREQDTLRIKEASVAVPRRPNVAPRDRSAAVLSYLFPGSAGQFNAQGDEAALSRLYGGIHYLSDINVGKEHGTRIGGYTIRFARQDGAD
jgi:hypothetical protein